MSSVQFDAPRLLAIGAAIIVVLTATGRAGAQGACSWDNAIGQPGMSHDVWSLFEFDDGEGSLLYAGGRFVTAGGETANGIARLKDGQWEPLGEGVGGVTNPIVYAMASMAEDEDSGLYVGGAFTTAGGEPANRIARWDGEGWAPLGEGLGNNVRALAVYDEGDGPALFAGGTFQTAGGENIVGIARWDGEEWSMVGGGLGGGLPYVYAMTVFDDGDGPALYVGGTFITAGGEPATNIARWDGEEWSDVGGGVDQWVTALTVFDDGTGDALYAGGAFGNAGGKQARRVARWDGEEWSALGSGVTGDFPWVEALVGFDDGTGEALYIGGWFETAGGQPANRIARWDGEAYSPLGAGLNERVWDLLVFDDGTGEALYVAGHFTAAGGQSASRIARWVCEPPVATGGGPDAAGLGLSVHPNPAAGATTLTFELPAPGLVRIAVFDLLGREVAVVIDGELPAGSHDVDWQARGQSSGLYVVRIEAPGAVESIRLTLAR